MHKKPHQSGNVGLDCRNIACHHNVEGNSGDFLCVDYFKEKFKERANGK